MRVLAHFEESSDKLLRLSPYRLYREGVPSPAGMDLTRATDLSTSLRLSSFSSTSGDSSATLTLALVEATRRQLRLIKARMWHVL